MTRWLRARPFLAVMLLASVLAFAFQGTRNLFEPDEGRYTNVALQMLHNDDFISLRRHHESLHFTKPPVTYWAIAGGVSALGWNEWGARVPIALAFLITVAMVYRLGRIFVPKRPWLPALIYTTLPFTVMAAYTINTDTMLAMATTLTVGCFLIARFEGRPHFYDWMWCALGLAFMTKGPPGLLHLLAIVAFCVWRGGTRAALLRPLGWLGFAVIGLSWYLIVIQRHQGLLEYFIGYEVYARVATDIHGRYPEWWGGFFVYGLVLSLGTLPWWPMVLARARALRSPLASWSEPAKFLLCWFVLPFLVFMLARSRLPLYILPLMAPLSLAAAMVLQRTSAPMRWGWLTATIVTLLGLKAVAAYLPLLYDDTHPPGFLHSQRNKDSELFAQHLHRVAPFAIQEVAFVDDMSRYGLHLYMGVEVEKLGLEAVARPKPLSDAVYDDILLDELKEPERETRVFVMKAERREIFEQQVRDSGFRPVALGQVFDRWVYAVERNAPTTP